MNKQAFTLAETLVVMLILSIITIVFNLLPAGSFQEQYEGRIFFDDLHASIYYFQDIAIVYGKATQIEFNANRQDIHFKAWGGLPYEKRMEVPEGWRLKTSYIQRYGEDGNADIGKTIYFDHLESGKKKDVVFQGAGEVVIR